MSKAAELIGDAPLYSSPSGTQTALPAEALAGKKYVAFYFSAHWCGPCRKFTPLLVTAYSAIKARDPALLEVVFVSADQDKNQFTEYRGEMPWLSLNPFEHNEATESLQQHFEVEGFPTLIVVDNATGKVVKKDAVQDVAKDPTGAQAPWADKSIGDILTDDLPITGKSALGGEKKTLGELKAAGATSVAIYFSAHWCPPCRAFTPHLASVYAALAASGRKDFEFLFASRDRDDHSFTEYHATMGFPAIKFGHSAVDQLMASLGVQGIPTLVTIDLKTNEVINANARGLAQKDASGSLFPWAPQPPPAVIDFDRDETTIAAFKSNKPIAVVDLSGLTIDQANACRTIVSNVSVSQGKPGASKYYAILGSGEGPRDLMKAVLQHAGGGEMSEVTPGTAMVYMITVGNRPTLLAKRTVATPTDAAAVAAALE